MITVTPEHYGGLQRFASALLAATLFLLSADLAFLFVAGYKIKLGYFLVLAAWLTAPVTMFAALRAAAPRVPRSSWLPLLPLAIAVATSANPRDSIAWTLWLGFDLFTIATVYSFLKAHRFSGGQVRRSVVWALAAIALFGVVQFVAIYGFGRIVFQPQSHFGVYRINGVSGWPHFLNIFAFLLLPIVLVQRRLRWPSALLLPLLMFVLAQSTAKTGWVLFVALGALLLLLDREVFRRAYLVFLLPVTVLALLVPVPMHTGDAPAVSAGEKISRFSADLDVSETTTSGADRVLINAMGLQVWLRHPWFGVGPRAYDEYVLTRFDQELPTANKFDANGSINTRNENVWIELAAETGILFTLAFAFVLCRALWVPRRKFANRLHLGAWMALVLYFVVSAQLSQSGLLTMVYAVFGIYFYARDLPATTAASADAATIVPRDEAAAG
ncbi:MAG: O-antigen ligase family protein [Burkholderiales bacterium]|nr:O-antigen ligase family protein [Burkholderiales bacterium]